jgi:hypothetical protein
MTSNALVQEIKSFVMAHPPLYRAAVVARRWLWRTQTLRWAVPNYLELRKAIRRVQRHGANRIGGIAAGIEQPHIVMLAVTDRFRDPRVEREAKTLAQAGYRVTVICPKAWLGERLPDWGSQIQFTTLPYRQSFYSYPFLYDRAMYDAALADMRADREWERVMEIYDHPGAGRAA